MITTIATQLNCRKCVVRHLKCRKFLIRQNCRIYDIYDIQKKRLASETFLGR